MNEVDDRAVEKEAVQNEASERTRRERNRIYSYSTLRVPCNMVTTRDYFEQEYASRRKRYKPEKDVSFQKARSATGISIWRYLKSRFSKEEKAKIDAEIKSSREQMQKDVEAGNRYEWERCERFNQELERKIDSRKEALTKGDSREIELYFDYVIQSDDYSVDNEVAYNLDYRIGFNEVTKRLVIDYRLPSCNEISDIKEWKVDKFLNVIPKSMPKKEYLKLYEQIIMDITIRVISLVFGSDDMDVISEIVFNGSCVYDDMDSPVVILSVLVKRKAIDLPRIRKMDFDSKATMSRFSEIRYLGDIKSDAPPTALLDAPPLKLITPIESNLSIV
ncbi:MAG: hypothetical protein LUG99_23290 [Lachnospiraceae bacterium]|nr:hypothetical protein [Lachnospiraceae bacterium]